MRKPKPIYKLSGPEGLVNLSLTVGPAWCGDNNFVGQVSEEFAKTMTPDTSAAAEIMAEVERVAARPEVGPWKYELERIKYALKLRRTPPAPLVDRRHKAADAVYEDYDFGCEVVGSDGWEWTTPGREYTRNVYLEGEEEDDDSVRVVFVVRFEATNADKIEEAYVSGR